MQEGRTKRSFLILGALVAICVPLWLLAFAKATQTVGEAPGKALKSVIDAFAPLLDSRTAVSMNHDVLTITPISEIALAKLSTKVTTVYRRTWGGSECVVVAEQEFVVKYGYDTTVAFRVKRGAAGDKEADIEVPDPRILSIEPATGAPTVLYQAGGLYNRVQPEDMTEIATQLFSSVKYQKAVREHQEMLRSMMRQQLKSLQKQLEALPASDTSK